MCVFAAPTTLDFDGVNVPANLSRAGLENWAADHADEVICDFDFRIGPIAVDAIAGVNSVPAATAPTAARRRQAGPRVRQAQPTSLPGPDPASGPLIARQNYSDYARQFLYPSTSLMIKSGLWLELEAVDRIRRRAGARIAASGSGRSPVILMIVLEVVLTPILSRARIPHLSNLQRAVVGLATAHLAPGGLPRARRGGGGGPGGGDGNPGLLPESTTVAVCVDRRLAGRLDGPRRVANDDQRRLSSARPGQGDGRSRFQAGRGARHQCGAEGQEWRLRPPAYDVRDN